MTEPLLQVLGLSKSFGGLAAVDNVSLEVSAGALHAVIGPNGAGKTTLINLLSGDLPASAGSILYRGVEIAHLTPEKRSRLGVGRSYQKVNIFPGFSAFENCGLAETHAILMVEHDMDAVFRLARVLTVMVNGKTLASGAPEAIRANREVQSAYLGNA